MLPSTASAAVIVVSPVSLIALHVYNPESEPRKSTITKQTVAAETQNNAVKDTKGLFTLTTWR